MSNSSGNTARKITPNDAMNGASQMTHSRIPPHSKESEESVLGGILLDNNAVDSALEKLSAEDFYQLDHRVIFEAITSLHQQSQPIDVVSLTQELRSKKNLETAGGMENLARLAAVVPSSANISYYAKVVKEMSLRRKTIHEASEIIMQAFEGEGKVEDFLDSIEQRILSISDNRVGASFSPVSEIVQESIKLVEHLYGQQDPITGTPSGFKKLDHMTAGFQPSDLIIIAARPSMGKTALALSVAQHVGVSPDAKTADDGGEKNGGVALFSLEMSKEQLVMRLLCQTAKVSSSQVRTGTLKEDDFPKLVEAASLIAEAPIFIDDTPALTITEMRAKCRRMHREHKLSLIMVDYLQLMRSPAYSNSREQEISDISRSLKALAKELNVPVIALSQLNRSLESRNDKRPIMSDLRESGAIEQDADVIMFIYRDEVYNEGTEDKGVAELIMAKQRNGPTGVVRTAFLPEFTLFANLDEREEFGDDFSGAEEIDLSEIDSDFF